MVERRALKALTDKQRRFVEEYMVDLNATQAAVRAGYSPKKTGLYTTLMGLAHVRAAVDEALAQKAARSRLSADAVLEELGKVAFANMLDFVRPGEGGAPVLDLRLVERDAGAAISKIAIEYFDGEVDKPRIKSVQLTLADKTRALREIARHLGLYREKVDLEVSAGPRRTVFVVTGVPRAEDGAVAGRVELAGPPIGS